MPTITLNKTVFENLVGKKLPLEELKDRISLLGTDLEKIDGEEIVVEIFPNRPDMLSEQGFARAFSSFIGVKTGLRRYEVKKSGLKVIVDKSVTMRPYTACAIVKNINFTDERIREIMQAQEKLATTHGRNRKKSAYGIYPLKGITFPINYIAKDPHLIMFQPLGFNHKIKASQVEIIHPAGQKYKLLAEGWKEYPFFIDSKDQVMCMLPYTNSNDTGKVDLDTKEVFIECTGNDLFNVQLALNIFVTMFADMGGDIYSLDIIYPDKTITTPNLTPSRMKLDLAYTNKRLGLNLKEQEAVHLLEKMGYGYEKGEVLIPSYRADILHSIDLVEDVAIAYGYEKFTEEIPQVSTIGEEAANEKFYRKVREILVGFGLLEVKNYHLMTAEELNQNMNLETEIVALKNAVGEYNHLRNSLLPSLMKNLKENQHNEYPQNIFEVGRTFIYGNSETGIIESDKLAVFFAHEKTDFTEIRQILDGLMSMLGLEFKVKESVHESFIPGRVGEIYIGDKSVGYIGELHPQVIINWSLAIPVVGFELDLETIFLDKFKTK
ncbi:phenylalanine--tRNA ligase subunit beta [Candidatus Woesearchaeota archaeon]|nr:phenylalanine--tRNA ligase subunit beta [Candidatus Woesearchaeota archaeon]